MSFLKKITAAKSFYQKILAHQIRAFDDESDDYENVDEASIPPKGLIDLVEKRVKAYEGDLFVKHEPGFLNVHDLDDPSVGINGQDVIQVDYKDGVWHVRWADKDPDFRQFITALVKSIQKWFQDNKMKCEMHRGMVTSSVLLSPTLKSALTNAIPKIARKLADEGSRATHDTVTDAILYGDALEDWFPKAQDELNGLYESEQNPHPPHWCRIWKLLF